MDASLQPVVARQDPGEAGGTAPSPEVLAEVADLTRQRIALRKKRIAAVRAFGLRYYAPHPKQAAFHAAGALFRRRMVRSGNRFGKSTMGVAEDCAWALGYRPWLPETDPACRAGIPQRPNRGLIITTNWEIVDDVFTGNRGSMGKFWTMLPEGSVKSSLRNHSGSIDTLELKNGSLLKFTTVKAFMTDPQSVESKDWDFIHVDEPCPEAMFKGCARGLMDRNGSAWFTLTPLREPWITDFFFPEDTRGVARSDVWSIDGSTYDNLYLSREAIASFESTLSDEEKQCRLYGIPLHLAGLVYKEFSWDRHVLKKLPEGWASWGSPPRNYSVYVYIDPHPQTPHAVLFCAVSPHGQRFYYTDLFERCSIAVLATKIHEILAGRQPVWVRLDPLGYVNNPVTESNMADEFVRCGLPVNKAVKALEAGIIKVKGELEKLDCIYFTPDCRRTLWEIQRYSWQEKENKPVDKDDHMMENLYRCEYEDPCWVDPLPSHNPAVDLEVLSPDFHLDREALSLSGAF